MERDYTSTPQKISIHAPREGSDNFRLQIQLDRRRFQSTLPARGATRGLTGKPRLTLISIHAPREGSDLQDHPTLK